jgi:hypothetical protein
MSSEAEADKSFIRTRNEWLAQLERINDCEEEGNSTQSSFKLL